MFSSIGRNSPRDFHVVIEVYYSYVYCTEVECDVIIVTICEVKIHTLFVLTLCKMHQGY